MCDLERLIVDIAILRALRLSFVRLCPPASAPQAERRTVVRFISLDEIVCGRVEAAQVHEGGPTIGTTIASTEPFPPAVVAVKARDASL